MKKVLCILILMSQFGWASDHDKAFATANTLYQAGKYDQAVKYYEKASNGKQLEAAELYFNLGNCYYKMHKVALSIYNYEKAKQLDQSDLEIETNLEFARKMTIDDIKIIPKVGFGKIIQDFTSIYYFDTWAWMAVFQALMVFIFFVGYYYASVSIKKRLFFIGMVLLIFGIFISLFSAYFEKNRLHSQNPAIVFADKVIVKTEPKKTSQDAFTLHEGTKVLIIESVANWNKIQLTDETTGWIEEKAIRSLRE